MEVSTLTGENVEKLFLTVGELMSFEGVFFRRPVAEFLVVSVHLHHSYSVSYYLKVSYYLCCKPVIFNSN